ncbi:MAG: NAD(+) synthase [Pseudobutyrivibrio sp.]|nr:NAD(+) synthase [Pseudobutyrivibrio sp.]
MLDGFIKIACATLDIKVGDTKGNAVKIVEEIKKASEKGVKAICFPELCVTGYTCGDLFLQELLLENAKEAASFIAESTAEFDIMSVIGMPLEVDNNLYNVGLVLCKGQALGAVAKENIPNYSEFYELRHFTAATSDFEATVEIGGLGQVTISNQQIFVCKEMKDFRLGVEICEDLWVPSSPSEKLAMAGATVIFNLSASDEVIGKGEYRKNLLKSKSGSLVCAYAYADAGVGESTQDMVFAAHNMIAENGSIKSEADFFENQMITADIDVEKLAHERRRMNTFSQISRYAKREFSLKVEETTIENVPYKLPFVPANRTNLDERCQQILTMQAVGLATRIKHIGCKNVVIGLSGGLDSTLALIVAVHAFDRLGLDRSGIKTITMPCFGTTDRTYNNACELAKCYGASLEEINIKASVTQHFADIGQDDSNHDVTYENSQARERTQILMDKANMYNGIVIGTGDLSELALGWATYNGDHMSMYAVNTSIPKTLVRWLVDYEANKSEGQLQAILKDILDTPVSPELLPPDEDGKIAQKTEDLVGPYELHDFFLYYMLRFGFRPRKIYRMACLAFEGEYSKDVVYKWLRTFYRRFFTQQFKRSCLPDGPKVGTVTLSPRGDFRMPSDASYRIWMDEIDAIK